MDAPSLDQIVRTLTFRAGYNTSIVVAGASLLGAGAGVTGTFALLRGRALVADAVSHATLPGICIAFLLAGSLGAEGKSLPVLLAGAAASGVAGVWAIQSLLRHTRLAPDAAIGAVLSVFFALGVVLLSIIQSLPWGTQAGLKQFIYGQTAAMGAGDAILMGGIALLAIIAVASLFKELALLCFNDAFAGVIGRPVRALDALILAFVVLITVAGLQAVGLILVVAMLIIPPAAARLWTERLWVMTLLAGVMGAASGYVGAVASALLPRKPAGSVIVLAAGALFAISLLLAPARGVIAAGARRARLGARVAREHALRTLFENEELRQGATMDLSHLARARGWGRVRGALVAWWLGRLGLVRVEGGGAALTDAGRRDAARLTRNHRLWERYLMEHAGVAASHVDFSADLVEHVLSPELVADLERALHAQGRLPSPHPLAPPDRAGS
jgi:manganese/zinc/iron transport system permease protein